MWKKTILIGLVILFSAACAQSARSPEPASPSTVGYPTEISPVSSEPAASPLSADRGDYFSASGACAACHGVMVDETGQDVSNVNQWRSTMLANAARDPYWQATVRSEVQLAPHLSAVIQEKCAACHMPMAATSLRFEEKEALIFDQGMSSSDHPLHNLALDAVSCTLCHQLDSGNFGQPESFSGGYLVDAALPAGERLLYGPYEVAADLTGIMQSASGFVAAQGLHMAQSEQCAACHDLYTPYIDDQGEVVGEFAEQLIYSEWENSAFANDKSCQDCHMPLAEGGVQLSITGGPLRSPFNQHTFVGGNAFMLRMLQANSAELSVTADSEHFDATLERTQTLMTEQTAVLAISSARVVDGRLEAQVSIESLVGHKFPGGYPSRRAWLHVRVLDVDGNVVFESGAVQPDGSIDGNDNDTDPAAYEPHYATLSTSDQVQIYEAIMQDTDEQVTTMLLRGARYIKDNRLLPTGFQPNPDVPALAPQGQCAADPDFIAGGDRLTLALELGESPATGGTPGPYTLQIELLYQSIGYRWAQNLIHESGPEIERFGAYYAALPNLPLTVAQVEVTISP